MNVVIFWGCDECGEVWRMWLMRWWKERNCCVWIFCWLDPAFPKGVVWLTVQNIYQYTTLTFWSSFPGKVVGYTRDCFEATLFCCNFSSLYSFSGLIFHSFFSENWKLTLSLTSNHHDMDENYHSRLASHQLIAQLFHYYSPMQLLKNRQHTWTHGDEKKMPKQIENQFLLFLTALNMGWFFFILSDLQNSLPDVAGDDKKDDADDNDMIPQWWSWWWQSYLLCRGLWQPKFSPKPCRAIHQIHQIDPIHSIHPLRQIHPIHPI